MGKKNTKQRAPSFPQKRTKQASDFINSDTQIWVFNSVDRDGEFRFDVNRDDMCHKDVLDKIIHYNARTWADILTETYGDSNKSKHHVLPYEHLSKGAKDRITKLGLDDECDSIFSMRLNNITRILGFRYGQFFIVKWFDPNHGFCPSNK